MSNSNEITPRRLPHMRKLVTDNEHDQLRCEIIAVAILSGVADKHYEMQPDDPTNP